MKRRMRQSTIGTGLICQQRMAFDLDPRENVEGEARAIGTAYHAGVELYYRSGGEAEAVDMIHAANEEWQRIVGSADRFIWETEEEAALIRLRLMLTEYVNGGHAWDLDRFQVIAIEQSFEYPWRETESSVWVASGTIDLILLGEDGWLRFADHKTSGRVWHPGKEKARQTPQPIWYMHWGYQWYLDNVADPYGAEREDKRLFYFDVMSCTRSRPKATFERRPATYSAHQHRLAFDVAERLAEVVDRGGPYLPNTSHYLCSHLYCDHWYRCPWGEQFNNTKA